MILSAKNAPSELTEKLEQELKELNHSSVNHYVTEKKLCLKHLLDGFPTRTMHGYDVANKVIEDLGKKFPEITAVE